jgi:hypothetical protein
MKAKPGVLISASLLAFSIFLVTAEDTVKTKPSSSTGTNKETSTAVVKGAPGTNFTTICYLERQDCTITVKAGEHGTVYSAKNKDGKVLCENASLEQLRAQAPELHQFIKSALAISSGKGGDARLKATDARLDARN